MTMTSAFRKFALATHITFSVGWLGAVAGFLALSIAGLTSKDTQVIRSTYLSMELIGWFVIVPACIGALLSGLVESFGTQWGLFQHYWVFVKFLLTIAATIILLVHMQPIGFIADIVSERTISNSEYSGLRIQLIADAGAALFVLCFATILSVYKPWGRTRYGLRKLEQNELIPANESTRRKPWRLYVMIGLICLILLFIILHLSDGGLGRH